MAEVCSPSPACSGAMYGGVPAIRPTVASVNTEPDGTPPTSGSLSWESVAPLPARANPKSMTNTSPSSATITFSGLKSRWMSPCWCAAASPRPARIKASRTSRQVRDAAADHARRV